ncbi:hypothetical protein [Fusibacter bizertensis]
MNVNLKEGDFENRLNTREKFKMQLIDSITDNQNNSFIVSGARFVGKSELINIVLSELKPSIKVHKHTILNIGSDSIYCDKSENKKFMEVLNETIKDRKSGFRKFLTVMINIVKSILYILGRIAIYFKSAGGIDLDEVLKYSKNDFLKYTKISKYFKKNKVILVVQDASQIDDSSFKLINSMLKNKKIKMIVIYEYKLDDSSNYDYYSFYSKLSKQTDLEPIEIQVEPLELEHCINIYKRQSKISLDSNLTPEILTELSKTHNFSNGNLYNFINFKTNIKTTDIDNSIDFERKFFSELPDNYKLIFYLIYLHQGKIQYSQLELLILNKRASKILFLDSTLIESTINKMIGDELLSEINNQLSIAKPSVLHFLNNTISDESDKIIKLIVYGMIIDFYTVELKDDYLNERNYGEIDKYAILLKLYMLYDLSSFTEIFDVFSKFYYERTSYDQKKTLLEKISCMDFKQLNSNTKIVHFAIEETFSMGMYRHTLNVLEKIYDESLFSHLVFRFMSEILLNQYDYYESIIDDVKRKYNNDSNKIFILNVVKYIYYLESDRKSKEDMKNFFMETTQENSIFYYFLLRSSSVIDIGTESINRLQQCLLFLNRLTIKLN